MRTLSESELRIVTYGRLSEDFYHYIRTDFPKLSISLATSKEDLREKIKTANCYAGFYALQGMDVSQLRWIHVFGAGIDPFLSDRSIANANLLISRSYGKMGALIGEYCLGHILSIYQNIVPYHSQQREENWTQLPSQSLENKQVLILGTGTIGQGIAEKLSGSQCKIIGVNTQGKQQPYFDSVVPAKDVSKVAGRSNICINCLPLTPDTDGLIDDAFLSQFNQAIFINVGRGKTIASDQVILNALEGNHLMKAVLDVFVNEPLAENSPLWKHPDIILTPHVSGISTIEDVKIGFEAALAGYRRKDFSLFVDQKAGY